ncbi:MAG: 7-cyano-7-deazaguanine synthase QueC [Methanospirillum sp.]
MKAVCLLSGGMDSSTLAYVARDRGYEILALHLHYGQRTEARELASARAVAERLGALEFLPVSIEYLRLFGKSSLTDRSIAVETYDPSAPELPNTYVPFRNGNLLAIATSYAESRDADAIFIGVQALDYSGYPDCRPQFIAAFQRAIDLGTADTTAIRLESPFVGLTKTDILRIGLGLGVPYDLTWSCYQSEDEACGVCGSCHYRQAAFAELGLSDRIPYRRRV